jgi:imidazole glycerol phosphate synthase subunit HisF
LDFVNSDTPTNTYVLTNELNVTSITYGGVAGTFKVNVNLDNIENVLFIPNISCGNGYNPITEIVDIVWNYNYTTNSYITFNIVDKNGSAVNNLEAYNLALEIRQYNTFTLL